MEVQTITTILFFSFVALYIFLERVRPYRKGLPFFREGWWVDFVWYSIIQSYLLKILIFDHIILPIDAKLELSRLQLITHWPLWVQVLFFFITHDLYIYWFHRWQHSSKILWRTHEAHHSVKEVDWLAGSRSHVVEIIINQTIEFAPIILLGARPEVVPIKALIDASWGMFIHSNIDVRMGKLQYLFNGPEMHQWHHADHKEVYHANFATKLALWDWLFGTAYLPSHKPTKYGLWYDFPKDYFMQHVFSVVRFDEQALLRYPWFKHYYFLRRDIMNQVHRLWQCAHEQSRGQMGERTLS